MPILSKHFYLNSRQTCDAIGELEGQEGGDQYCLDKCLAYPSRCPSHRCRCYWMHSANASKQVHQFAIRVHGYRHSANCSQYICWAPQFSRDSITPDRFARMSENELKYICSSFNSIHWRTDEKNASATYFYFPISQISINEQNSKKLGWKVFLKTK